MRSKRKWSEFSPLLPYQWEYGYEVWCYREINLEATDGKAAGWNQSVSPTLLQRATPALKYLQISGVREKNNHLFCIIYFLFSNLQSNLTPILSPHCADGLLLFLLFGGFSCTRSCFPEYYIKFLKSNTMKNFLPKAATSEP